MTDVGHGLSRDRAQSLVFRVMPVLLVALATLIAIAAIGVGLAHATLLQPTGLTQCLVLTDARTGVRGVPKSSCLLNSSESQPVRYSFNECGLRTEQPCSPAAPGVFRIVMIGSSFDFGLYVPQSQGLASLLGPVLSEGLKRPVDVFNESMYGAFPDSWPHRSTQILQPHPDMIIWPLTPHDVVRLADEQDHEPAVKSLPAGNPLLDAPVKVWTGAIKKFTDSTEGVFLQHYLFLSRSQYLSHALMAGKDSEYLRTPTTASEKRSFARFVDYFHQVAAIARAAKVPLVVTLLPSREQAIMLSNHSWDKGYDPDLLGRQIRALVQAEGAHYIDIMPGVATSIDAGSAYLPVDEHPNAQGHRIFATLLGSAMIRSGVIAGAGQNRP